MAVVQLPAIPPIAVTIEQAAKLIGTNDKQIRRAISLTNCRQSAWASPTVSRLPILPGGLSGRKSFYEVIVYWQNPRIEFGSS